MNKKSRTARTTKAKRHPRAAASTSPGYCSIGPGVDVTVGVRGDNEAVGVDDCDGVGVAICIGVGTAGDVDTGAAGSVGVGVAVRVKVGGTAVRVGGGDVTGGGTGVGVLVGVRVGAGGLR
jgi:hypothetical protein